MKNWTKYAFIRLVFFLMIGIILAYESNFFPPSIYYFFIALVFTYIIIVTCFTKNIQTSYKSFIGSLAFLIVFLFGWIQTHQSIPINHSKHVIHHLDSIVAYVARIDSKPKETTKTYQFSLSILKIKVGEKWQDARGKCIAYFKKNVLDKKTLLYGDKIMVYGSPQKLSKPLNPHAFDYSRYLNLKNIYLQHFISLNEFVLLSKNNSFSWQVLASHARTYLDTQLSKVCSNPTNHAIASALILGNKGYLDEETKNAFIGAGITHILAVSGLHVGIVMFIIQLIFKRQKKKSNFWRWFVTILSIVLLWCYAFITGFSPSVMRACTMFSIILLSNEIGKNTNIYNTIAFSAFFLLIFNPLLLFSLSFQLSYIAVIGIVYLQPKISQWYSSTHKIINGAWEIIAVSIAAQIATVPISLYYFHQFSNISMLANIMVLPVLPTILVLGFLVLFLQGVFGVTLGLGFVFNFLLGMLNNVIVWISRLPYAISHDIPMSFLELILVYACVISVLVLLAKKRLHYAWLSLLTIVAYTGLKVYQNIWQNQHNQLTLYHVPKKSVIQITRGNNALFLTDDMLKKDSDIFKYNIQGYYQYLGIKQFQSVLFSGNEHQEYLTYKDCGRFGLLVWKQKVFLILKENFYPNHYQAIAQLSVDFIIIKNNAVYSLKHLPPNLIHKKIIVDGSNYYKRQKKLKSEAKALILDIYFTNEEGAFVLESS